MHETTNNRIDPRASLALLIRFFEFHFAIPGNLRHVLACPLDFLCQVVNRPRRCRRSVDGLLGSPAGFFFFGRLIFLHGRVDCHPARRGGDFIHLARRQDVIDASAAGLEEDSSRAVELEEELDKLLAGSRTCRWNISAYPISPDGYPGPGPQPVEYLHGSLPRVGFGHVADEL